MSSADITCRWTWLGPKLLFSYHSLAQSRSGGTYKIANTRITVWAASCTAKIQMDIEEGEYKKISRARFPRWALFCVCDIICVFCFAMQCSLVGFKLCSIIISCTFIRAFGCLVFVLCWLVVHVSAFFLDSHYLNAHSGCGFIKRKHHSGALFHIAFCFCWFCFMWA